MGKPAAKLMLLQALEPDLAAAGFKLNKSRAAFERRRDPVTDLYKLDFYTSRAGDRIQPAIIMRYDELDEIYHQVSGAKPADRKYHAAVSFAIWRVHGGMDKYEFLLTGDSAVGEVAEKVIATFRSIAVPFFESHSTIADVDRLFNTAPNDPSTVLYNTDGWTRCAYATIAARLAGNPNCADLMRVYEGFMAVSEGGHRLGQYMALVALLDKQASAPA